MCPVFFVYSVGDGAHDVPPGESVTGQDKSGSALTKNFSGDTTGTHTDNLWDVEGAVPYNKVLSVT